MINLKSKEECNLVENFFVSSELKKRGISVISKLPDKSVVHLSTQIADRITSAFSNENIDYMHILKTLIDTPMYIAKNRKGGFKANYFYKNSSLYISDDSDLYYANPFIFHECIHKIQEVKNKKGKIERFGICEINNNGIKAQALNEGAIQYIISQAFSPKEKLVNNYDIYFRTQAFFYQILSNIIESLCIVTSKKVMLDSALNGNEEFKIAIINELGEGTYNLIEKRTDDILKFQNIIYSSKSANKKYKQSLKEIKDAYFEIQRLIYLSYFDNYLKRTENEKDIMTLIKKMAQYSRVIGFSIDNKEFYKYREEFFKRANERLLEFKNKSLVVVSDNPITRLFNKIRLLFGNQNESTNRA